MILRTPRPSKISKAGETILSIKVTQRILKPSHLLYLVRENRDFLIFKEIRWTKKMKGKYLPLTLRPGARIMAI
jgi:hypothetical protein